MGVLTPLISIIVPVYNAEKTLQRCIHSLQCQTFTDFEILLIDDGSLDHSGQICDEYSAKDRRIRVIHKRYNKGVSSARQTGIDIAQGKYTIHVDPDDWVEPTMLEELYQKAVEHNADMVICDFFENSLTQQKYIKQQPTSLDSEIILGDILVKLHGSCCNKLITLECYQKYNVRFPENISYCEDQYVIAAILKHHITIAYLSKAFYHYFNIQSAGTLSRRYNEKTLLEDLTIKELFTVLYQDTPYRNFASYIKTFSLLTRAFYLGKKFYTSRDYRNHFKIYKNIPFKVKQIALYERILIYFSCLGFYRQMHQLFMLMFDLKSRLK